MLPRLNAAYLTAERQCQARERGVLPDEFLVDQVIECANIADFATIDDEAGYLGIPHRALHRSRRLTTLQCEFPLLLQFREKRVAGMFYLPNNFLLRFLQYFITS